MIEDEVAGMLYYQYLIARVEGYTTTDEDFAIFLLAEIKRMYAYIDYILVFNSGVLDIETYEDYKERVA